jgi:protein-disulfide isomerase
MRGKLFAVAVVVATLFAAVPGRAQFAGTSPSTRVHLSGVPRPPAGSKVALVVFEDLGCPACARMHPAELDAVQKTHVPLLRYDFPIPSHIWTFQGAVDARYMQEKIDPKLADAYRSDVFKSQQLISSKDDLQKFTQAWMQKHGKQMPADIDPDGKLAKEVQADFDLARSLNVQYTPTIVVVTADQQQLVCGTAGVPPPPSQILTVLQAAIAKTQSEPASTSPAKKAKP